MKDTDDFIKAYTEFRESVDFSRTGFLPDVDNLVWMLLMGIPAVPADAYLSEEGPMEAVKQRISILKAVFVEVNRDREDDFLDQGLSLYDQAGKLVGIMLQNTKPPGNAAADEPREDDEVRIFIERKSDGE